MGIKITKAEYDALPDSLKAKFKGEGDAFELLEEDVEGLKKSKAEILEEKKRIQAERDELAKFKADHDAKTAEAETEAAKKAGEFEKVEAAYKKRIADMEADFAAKDAKRLGTIKTEKLKSFLVEHGVLPDRAKYALADTLDQFDLEEGEQGFALKLQGGIGDAKELDAAVGKLKDTSPFLFAANGASGSGASGSQQQGGQTAKTMPKAQWDALSVQDQAAFIKEGGKPVD